MPQRLPALPAFDRPEHMELPLINWQPIVLMLVQLGLAYAFALPVAWDREQQVRSAGLRTFPLVAVASCAYMLFGAEFFIGEPDARARLLAGLITGIGFIGGGAILKEGGSVRGTATAASIWNTGAIGAAVAYERYEVALVLSIINFATLRWLTPLKKKAAPRRETEHDHDAR